MLRPLNGSIVVRILRDRAARDKITYGRELPFDISTLRHEFEIATVVSVGPGKLRKNGVRVPPDVRPEDVVAIAAHWDATKQAWLVGELLDDHDLVIIKEEDVLCRIEE